MDPFCFFKAFGICTEPALEAAQPEWWSGRLSARGGRSAEAEREVSEGRQEGHRRPQQPQQPQQQQQQPGHYHGPQYEPEQLEFDGAAANVIAMAVSLCGPNSSMGITDGPEGGWGGNAISRGYAQAPADNVNNTKNHSAPGSSYVAWKLAADAAKPNAN
eukprot:GHVT01081549.1.p1 GENE.GHVT01081549.1~~GHVT01081549.1.p1  ORF type:complete len:160 (-),score=46.96 GHVT01081549.1:798-1277(-)